MSRDIDDYQAKLQRRDEDVQSAAKVTRSTLTALAIDGVAELARIVGGPVIGYAVQKAAGLVFGAAAEANIARTLERNRAADREVRRLVAEGRVPPMRIPL